MGVATTCILVDVQTRRALSMRFWLLSLMDLSAQKVFSTDDLHVKYFRSGQFPRLPLN